MSDTDARRALLAAGIKRLRAQIAEVIDRMDQDLGNGRGYARDDMDRLDRLRGELHAMRREASGHGS